MKTGNIDSIWPVRLQLTYLTIQQLLNSGFSDNLQIFIFGYCVYFCPIADHPKQHLHSKCQILRHSLEEGPTPWKSHRAHGRDKYNRPRGILYRRQYARFCQPDYLGILRNPID